MHYRAGAGLLVGIVMLVTLSVPCDAPFSAAFTVEQSGRQVAPIISPTSQARPVTVAE